MQLFLGFLVPKDPRLTSVYKLAHNEGIEELHSFALGDIAILVYHFAMKIEGRMGDGDSSLHLLPVITPVVEQSTQMLILSNHRNLLRASFTNYWNATCRARSK